MNENKDVDLVVEVLNGNVNAFEEIVKRYQKPIYNLAYKMVGNYDEAKDVAQNTFIKSFEKLGSFDPNYKFFSWIYRIALNEALNLVSSKKRFIVLDDSITKTAGSPAEDFEAKEKADMVNGALAELKDDYKVLIVLKHYQGLSYDEIAEVLNISVQKVKSRLFMARQLLKDILLQNDGF